MPNGKTEWNVTEKLARERGVGRGRMTGKPLLWLVNQFYW